MTNFLEIADLMVGANNFVECGGIQREQEVLIIASTDAEPNLIQAITAAAKLAGTNVTISYIPPPAIYFKEPPPPIAEAMCAADLVLDVGAFVSMHTHACFVARFEYGTRFCMLVPPPKGEVLKTEAAKFPLELYAKILEKVCEICQAEDGTKIELTSPGGTNITSEVWRIYTKSPGKTSNIFPVGTFGFVPPRNTNGHAVFEAFAGYGKTSQPIEFLVKNDFVQEVHGGWEAEEVRDLINKIHNGNYVCEIMFGINPRNRVDLATKPLSLEAERSPKTLHIGLGSMKIGGAPRSAKGEGADWNIFHTDGFMVYPTLTVGKTAVLEHGHLTVLDDPEVLQLAGTYGDPKKVLKYFPVLV
jgi:hypothetical protein